MSVPEKAKPQKKRYEVVIDPKTGKPLTDPKTGKKQKALTRI